MEITQTLNRIFQLAVEFFEENGPVLPAYWGQFGCGSGHAWVRLGCIGGSRWNRAGLNRLLNRRKCGKQKGVGGFGGDFSIWRSRVGAPGWSGGCRELSLGVPDSEGVGSGQRVPVGIIKNEERRFAIIEWTEGSGANWGMGSGAKEGRLF